MEWTICCEDMKYPEVENDTEHECVGSCENAYICNVGYPWGIIVPGYCPGEENGCCDRGY